MIDNLYEENTHILCQIEEGLNAQLIPNPIVGFQGVAGAYGEEAAYSYFKGNWSKLVAHETFEDVIEALLNGSIHYGVLPIENSSAGEVFDTYDLIKNNALYIVGELSIKIEQNLLAIKGATIEDIKEVYSHPQGLSQSKPFLRQHPNITAYPYVNTAIACKYVADLKDKTKAAIGSIRSAELYDLDVLAPRIQFNQNNYTRFIVLANHLYIREECDKISIVFSTEHQSGALYHILGYFANNGVNLLKIQSRPRIDEKWQYYFFADFEGNLEQANVLIALSQIMNQCNYFKILGNYKQNG